MNSWDVFFSYHGDTSNQQKVIEIRNFLISNLRITTWFDSIEVTQPGERSKKIFQGVSNSKIFLCFVTPEYSDSEGCLNELYLAKRLGKKMLFYVSKEDTTGMDQEQLTKMFLRQSHFTWVTTFTIEQNKSSWTVLELQKNYLQQMLV